MMFDGQLLSLCALSEFVGNGRSPLSFLGVGVSKDETSFFLISATSSFR